MQIPRHTYFEQMPVGSIKAPSGHFLHFAPARPDDDSLTKNSKNLKHSKSLQVALLLRLKQIARDIHLVGNEGALGLRANAASAWPAVAN
jgi:hypothetical protein